MTVVATDAFTRSNGAVGANWTTHGPYTTPQIVSNAIQSSAGVDYAATYSAANAGQDDMYTKASAVVTTSIGGNDVIVWCRMPNDATETGYMFDSPTFTGSTFSWTMQRASSGTFTTLASLLTGGPIGVSTHTIEVRAVGTTVSAYIDGVSVASVTDSTHSGSTKRYGGIHVYSDNTNACSLDNFEMGTIGGPTPVSQSDTGAGTDSQTLATSRTQTEAGAGSDSQTVAIASTQTDAGAGSEAIPKISQSSTDTGAGADSQTLAAAVAQSDTGAGTDSWSIQVTFTQTDSGAGADSQSVNTGGDPPTQTETGTGSDAQTIAASQTQTDSGAGTEATPQIAQATSDSGAGSEATPKIGTGQSDTGTGSDSQATNAAVAQSDTGTGTDTWSIVVRFTQSDTGAGTESQNVTIGGVPVPKSDSDTATAIEGWSIQVTHPAPGSPGFTKLASLTITRRLEDMSRNSRPMPGAKRWPGRRP